MKRFVQLLSVIIVCLSLPHMSVAQSVSSRSFRIITQDAKGRFITSYANTLSDPPVYLGTPYLDDKLWHQGYLVYRNQREIPAAIAFNLVFDQVYCALSDSAGIVEALPDEFIFEGRRFVGVPYKFMGIRRVTYYEVLYDGKTKLFCRWTKQLHSIDRKLYTRRTAFDDRFDGKYKLSKDLYIAKAGDRPRFIVPTEYSLNRVLPNMGASLANYIAAHNQRLSDDVLIEILRQYDSRYLAEQSQ